MLSTRFSCNYCFVVLALVSVFACGVCPADQSIQGAAEPGKTLNCKMQIEFQGDVVLFSTEQPPKNLRLPIDVTSRQRFDQIAIDANNFLRKYEVANARIKLDGKPNESSLSESNRQITIRHTSSETNRPLQYFSTGGALRQSEKDLLTVPADIIAIQQLIQQESISANKEWHPENSGVQSFFSLDNLIENEIKVSVKEIKGDLAKIYITGKAKGEVDSATTTLNIVGVAIFDTEKQAMTAFRGTVNENRSPSQLAPGFVGSVKIDTTCDVKPNRNLSEEVVSQVKSKLAESQTTRMLWNSDSEFELLYDPKWKVILSDPEVVVLRYADRGSLLAQCNVLRLPKRPADKPLSLDEFREQLAKNVLGEAEARINGSQVLQTNSGMRVLQVVVTGTQEEVPIHWVYYHLSNDEGQCVAVVLTVEDELLPLLAKADLKLLESIHFVAPSRKNVSNSKTELKR